jgi:hypothetical protein
MVVEVCWMEGVHRERPFVVSRGVFPAAVRGWAFSIAALDKRVTSPRGKNWMTKLTAN